MEWRKLIAYGLAGIIPLSLAAAIYQAADASFYLLWLSNGWVLLVGFACALVLFWLAGSWRWGSVLARSTDTRN